MATALEQKRYRSKDTKKLIQARLSPEALARLDKLAVRSEAAGRGDALECLLLAQGKGESPEWILHEAIRLGRTYLRLAGVDEGALKDANGWFYTLRRER